MNIDMDVNALELGIQKLDVVNNKINDLKNAMSKIDLSNTELESASLYENANKIIDDLTSGASTTSSINALREKINNIRSILIENNSEMLELFEHFDAMTLEEFGDYLDSFENDEITDMDYILDIYELLSIYQSGDLDRLCDVYGYTNNAFYHLFDILDENGEVVQDGEQYVKSLLEEIQNKYSGREAAVNSALLLLQLAADKNIKLNYVNRTPPTVSAILGTEVTLDYLINGANCNVFISWVIAQGVADEYGWRSCQTYDSDKYFKTISFDNWGDAKPGDILTDHDPSKGAGGHVSIIIENDVENKRFIIAEASSEKNGIRMSEISYDDASNKYKVKDMSEFYDDNVFTGNGEVVEEESIKEESINKEESGKESIKEESINKEESGKESIKEESINKEESGKESIKEESINKEESGKEFIKDKLVDKEINRNEYIRTDKYAIKEETKNESINEVINNNENVIEEHIVVDKNIVKDETKNESVIEELVNEENNKNDYIIDNIDDNSNNYEESDTIVNNDVNVQDNMVNYSNDRKNVSQYLITGIIGSCVAFMSAKISKIIKNSKKNNDV